MKNLIRSEPTLTVIALVMVITLAIPIAFLAIHPQVAHAVAQASSNPKSNNPVCTQNGLQNGHGIELSQGGQMFCKGPQSSSPSSSSTGSSSSNPSFGSNVDAANPQEDVTPSGVQIHGQSETSVASAGPYVVEAWNDGTGFFAPCPSPQNKQELTGFGFSTDGGKTFTDLGGLPNANCSTSKIFGDPSVEAFQSGGSTFFYISSIFIPFTVPENALSVTACQVMGSGATATLACGQPIVAAISSQCVTQPFAFCSFLDKEFLSVDAARGRLYVSYTEFFFSFVTFTTTTTVELAVCDLSTPASPTCHNGSDGSITPPGAPAAAPYLVVAPSDVNGCENEGAYPAVDRATGDVYVAYEHNWFTGLFGCFNGTTVVFEPTQNVMNAIPFSCLPLASTSPCAGPAATQAVNITSLEAAFIPGYNRFPMNDFPRLAVSDPARTVSMVWNDTRQHGTGDILLQSFNLGSLGLVQSSPVRINSRNDTGGWIFLPALRNADGQGNLDVSFYSRSSANTALTNVKAALKVDPRTTSTPTKNDTTLTTGESDWNAVSSIIIPNFGDYTDNYFLGTTLFVAWSDGRLGFPNPFEDHVSVH